MKIVLHKSYDKEWVLAQSSPLHGGAIRALRHQAGNELLLLSSCSDSFDLRASHFVSPSRFAWLPDQASLRQIVSDRDSLFNKFRHNTVHLLIDEGRCYYYAGVASLGAVTLPDDPATIYWFRVDPKLDRATWQRLGGYGGWRVIINDSEDVNILNHQDLLAFLCRVSSRPRLFVEATRYEEDSFKLFVNDQLAVVDYKSPSGELFVSSNASYSGDPFGEIEFSFPVVGSFEFLKALVIPREHALDSFASHIQHGQPVGLKPWAPPTQGQGNRCEPHDGHDDDNGSGEETG
jgi:hypothetical protein